MLRSRLSRRLLAQQHLALSSTAGVSVRAHPPHGASARALEPTRPARSLDERACLPQRACCPLVTPQGGVVGVVGTDLAATGFTDLAIARAREVCRHTYGVAPRIVVDGNLNARLSGIPEHIDYVLYELLKNAQRAVVEQAGYRMGSPAAVQKSLVRPPRRRGRLGSGHRGPLRLALMERSPRGFHTDGWAGRPAAGGPPACRRPGRASRCATLVAAAQRRAAASRDCRDDRAEPARPGLPCVGPRPRCRARAGSSGTGGRPRTTTSAAVQPSHRPLGWAPRPLWLACPLSRCSTTRSRRRPPSTLSR